MAIMAAVGVQSADRAERRRAVSMAKALIGQSGTGKTTTIAKLAGRMVRAGRRVVLATLDSGRIGVEAQLRAFGAELRVPTISLDDPARIAAELTCRHLVDK